MRYLTWASDLVKAYILKNAVKVVELVQAPDIDNWDLIKTPAHTSSQVDHRICEISDQKLKKYFVQWVTALLHYLAEIRRADDPLLTFTHFHDAVRAFLGVFKNDISQGKWIAGIISYFCAEILLRAQQADKHHSSSPTKEKAYDDTARLLRDYFAACQTLKEDVSNSRVISALPIINTLLKIYFRRNILRQSLGLTLWVDQGMVPLSRFRRSDILTYQFYAGRLALLEGKYQKAEDLLESAFNLIPSHFFHNKRLALRYLVPVKMYLGQYPSSGLLARYRLKEYALVVSAVREGNLRVFDGELEKWQAFYIRQGLYVQMEKLRNIALRNLVRFVLKCSVEKVQVPLEIIHIGLKEAGEEEDDLELDEAEALLANLMFKGWIKGYLSHEKRKVVFSKAAPFPSLREVVAHMPDLHL